MISFLCRNSLELLRWISALTYNRMSCDDVVGVSWIVGQFSKALSSWGWWRKVTINRTLGSEETLMNWEANNAREASSHSSRPSTISVNCGKHGRSSDITSQSSENLTSTTLLSESAITRLMATAYCGSVWIVCICNILESRAAANASHVACSLRVVPWKEWMMAKLVSADFDKWFAIVDFPLPKSTC